MNDAGSAFDSVAEEYLRSRSEYPAEMIDHIARSSALVSQSRVLDVGCGSGQATLAFARRGYQVVGVDPAGNALELLAERCREFPNVDLVHSAFEDYNEEARFDLITSAQAFHWLDPKTAPIKFVDLLKPGGSVALSWHLQDIEPGSDQADLYVRSGKYFSSFPVMNPPEYGREFIEAMAQILIDSSCFEDVRTTEYTWSQSYEPEMFVLLFRSASNYARLDEDSRRRVDAELAEYLDGLSAPPVINYRTCLIQGSAL